MINELPSHADLKTWQAIAHKQHAEILRKDAELTYQEALVAKLTAEIAQLKRLQFGRKAESFVAEQRQLFDETMAEDIAAIEQQLQQAVPETASTARQPKRQALPAELPREVIKHEPESCACEQCGGQLNFIRDEISEQLEYVPASFIVKQHVRPQYSCRQCDKVISAPMPTQLIDKGIPGPGLLAQVAINKYADHLPLYRQEQIFARSGVNLSSSTLSSWIGAIGVALDPLVQTMREDLLKQAILHADETPVQMLDPGLGKTKRAYLWLYRSSSTAKQQMAIYDFHASRAGIHAQHFLQDYAGSLMVDDYGGYKALFAPPFNLTELGCWAHVRRKFFDLFNANKSEQAQTALTMIQKLYEIERQASSLDVQSRQKLREEQAKPILCELHQWLSASRTKIPKGTGLVKAIDYTLNRWPALIRYLECGHRPIDNNLAENSIRPIALGRKNWLFAGSLSAGKRAAMIMSLIETAKLNKHDPFEYLKSILTKLPTWPNSRIRELLPYHWQPEQQD